MLKLLIGYDGSVCAALAMQDLLRAGLPSDNVEAIVMCVAEVRPASGTIESTEPSSPATVPSDPQIGDALAHARSIALDGAAQVARAFPGWRVEAQTAASSPYWGLVRKAHDWRADLLAVGSRGRSGLGRMVSGSVSQNAVLYADCSVRVGRCDAVRANAQEIRIIVGWDASHDAGLALGAVACRCWPPGSRCRVVTAFNLHLTTLIRARRKSPALIQVEREYLERRIRLSSDALCASGLVLDDYLIREGDPKQILLEEAKTWDADCIFVGAKGLSGIRRVLLGSVSAAVAARAACSVEIVRSRRR